MRKIATDNFDNTYQQSDKPSLSERRLLSAILYRAIRDLTAEEILIRRDANLWFSEKPDHRKFLSFAFICAKLNLQRQKILDTIYAKEFDISKSKIIL